MKLQVHISKFPCLLVLIPDQVSLVMKFGDHPIFNIFSL